MKKTIGLAVVLGFLLSANVALAQDDKTKVIDFEDDLIEGELMMPTSSSISVKELDELSSLIKAREDFVDEMRKTVDDL